MTVISSKEQDNKFLRGWTFYDLQNKIIEKAESYGIKIVKVNPEYTSQRCSECGYIDANNRLRQDTFICQKCGYGSKYICNSCQHIQTGSGVCEKCKGSVKPMVVNADYNAARNLAIKGIDKIIKKETSK